jgi:uncharacterized protein GlcG (DUF336 family)
VCLDACANGAAWPALTVADVERVIAQAVGEAGALNRPATISVVDRVGNVLAVFRMAGAVSTVTITSGHGVAGGLEGLEVIPSTLAAIAKALTGAYLSSGGNAFSSRTAGQIIQQHFNPGEFGQPGGPLFGVQFSQLPCSDLSTRFTADADAGPKRSPLGLSADPGGLPLYKEGEVVGGIGVVADPVYGLDLNIFDTDLDADELIAVAASHGFEAPTDVRANRIAVEGRTLRFTDVTAADLVSDPRFADDFDMIDGFAGDLVPVTAYSSGAVLHGTAFGAPASGIRPDAGDYPGRDAFVLVDSNQLERYPPSAGSDGPDALSADEVRTVIQQALEVANRARAQIRRPRGDYARVTISIVDTNGKVLAIARSRDAPVFGIDVALQKARTAAFFSNAAAAADFASAPNAVYRNPDGSPSGAEIVLEDYVEAARIFLGRPTALADGAVAFSDRAGGNLSRPFYPDGIDGTQAGPFSKPIEQWSPFSDGLQLDLSLNRIVQHVVHVLSGGGEPDSEPNCTSIARLANGSQIFPGSVPIYRGPTLVGGIGVSGDGVDQDDMIAFLGLHQAAGLLGTINNAPPAMRADQLLPQGARLRFVQCPFAPFIDSHETNACAGK